MKLIAVIPNIYQATLVGVLVVIGVVNYSPSAEKLPVKVDETPAVLSQEQVEAAPPASPVLELPIRLPLPEIPSVTVPVQAPILATTPIQTPPSNDTPAPTDVTLVQTVSDTAVRNLENRDSQAFYNLLSADLTSTYTEGEIESALSATGQQITSVRNLGDPNITGDYADQNVEVTTGTGTYRFQVFLHKESGVWKIMGTEPLP